jgi:hypothetical protein
MLHAGARSASLDEVMSVRTPPPTDTHYPIPHARLIESVTLGLEGVGLTIDETDFGLWGDDGEMMVGVISLRTTQPDNLIGMSADYRTVLGVRNAHNKRFAAGLACGHFVFVCDNLAMSGDIVVFRKHTKNILNDLDRLLFDAIGGLREAKINQDRRIANYKNTDLTDQMVHDILIRAVDAQIMANAKIPAVLKEWREPRHEAFEDRTAWSLLNGFTEVFKDANALTLPPKTTRLHGLLDVVAEVGTATFTDDGIPAEAIAA